MTTPATSTARLDAAQIRALIDPSQVPAAALVSCANCNWHAFHFGTAPHDRIRCVLNGYAWPARHACDDFQRV